MTSSVRMLAACLVSGLAVASVRADDPKKGPFTDAMFVTKAASGGMAEVELGKIAQMKATMPGVKMFGERMVADHTKANTDLKAVAAEAGIPVPATMTEEDQKTVAMFRDYKGENFDRDYVKDMVEDHENDVALFERAAREAKDPRLKEFALKTLPTLKEHLAMAKKLNAKLSPK